MAFMDFVKSVFQSKSDRQVQYAKMLDGLTPMFSQFGQNIYASDVVQMCIDAIASECSKLQPKHIYTGSEGIQQIPKSSINRLFRFAPNDLMTTRDFIEKVIWLLYKNYNCFILPAYEIVTDARGFQSRYYTGFYPLNPTRVDFLTDSAGTLLCRLFFGGSETFTLPYVDLIHLRKRYSANEIMGGGASGQPDNAALLKVLEVNDVVLQGIPKAIKTGLSVRGIIKIATMLDDDQQKAERARLEATIESGKSGIIPMDLKGDFIPVNVDPKMLDKETMDFLQNKVLNYFGVPVPILTGTYTDDQYQAFYEKTLEPIIIGLGQAFSKTIFTQRELDVGNEIVFYQKDLMYMSTASKMSLIKIAGEQGILSDNQKLALLGYPPIDGGERITQSLNYIDKALINSYQLSGSAPPRKGDES